MVALNIGGGMRKIHRRSAGEKEARICFSQITDNHFSGVDAALIEYAANGRKDSFGEGAKSRLPRRPLSFWRS
jgi:hypothetical protein